MSVPISSDNDQAHGLRGVSPTGTVTRQHGRLRCLAVSSGKGGVGKTLISVGISMALARRGRKVLLLDADLGLANVDIQMGLEPAITLQDVVCGEHTLADAVVHVPDGPDVLPGASGAPELVDMGRARRDMLVHELIQFASAYDFLIVDAGAGIGSQVTSFLKAVPEVLVVMVNEPTSLMDAYSLIKVLRREPMPPAVSLVVNQARSFEDGEAMAVRLNRITQRFLGIELPLAGVVLQDPVVGDAVRRRRPVVDHAARSAAAQCLAELADRVAGAAVTVAGCNSAGTFLARLVSGRTAGSVEAGA